MHARAVLTGGGRPCRHDRHLHVPRRRIRRAQWCRVGPAGGAASQGLSHARRRRRAADRGVMADLVVIGGGLTGASAAIALRKYSVDAHVTLIGEEDQAPYERPPLSKGYLRGELPLEQLPVRPPAFYAQQGIDTLFGARAERIHATQRIVYLEGERRVPFDRLLIATGVRNRRPPIPGLELPGVHQLRTIRDATRLRAEMRPGRKAVVVGMGFIGCEVAAALRHHQIEVVSIDPGPTPLARALGETVGGTLASLHASYGVHTIFNDTVQAFEGNGRIARVITAAGLRIPCDFGVVGVGVEPVTGLLDGSEIRIDNGIVVEIGRASRRERGDIKADVA